MPDSHMSRRAELRAQVSMLGARVVISNTRETLPFPELSTGKADIPFAPDTALITEARRFIFAGRSYGTLKYALPPSSSGPGYLVLSQETGVRFP